MAAQDANTKFCRRCSQSKALRHFYTSPKGRRESWCRECQAVYRADYYEQHRDQINERRGPYSREYAKRKRNASPEARQKSIAAVRSWWSSLPREEQQRLNQRKKLLKRYGLTTEQWESMKKAQNGACAICGDKPTEKNFHVDHCHSTGRVRGLLCVGCNTALAWFEKVHGRLDKVLSYLGIEQGL